ncbi:MAG: hypothetical protein VCC00_04140 [Deltaproteobacteria bacterium]
MAESSIALLGMEVRAPSSEIHLAGGSADPLHFEVTRDGVIEAEIRDARGLKVRSMPLGAYASGSHLFDPTTLTEGVGLPDGRYHITFRYQGGEAGTLASFAEGRVDGIEFDETGDFLLVGGHREYGAPDRYGNRGQWVLRSH